ncbi:sodium channel protein Nach [Agrilus planipennis]|uniref:Sodium channel protein Nach n=1 Tax=Agrilus planipennis TaxID=224129 RepID=A0A1W4WD96_AGRPL|nr:sodium channel protein Nach [Agrilus planipennis]
MTRNVRQSIGVQCFSAVTKSLFKQYVTTTTFHGYKYLGENGLHWTERLFWLTVCMISIVASIFLMKASWYDFQNNALSFVVDTNYLEWDTKFPSISVCETDNQDKIASASDRLFGDPHDYNLDEVMKEMLFFRGLSYYTIQTCESEENVDNCLVTNVNVYEYLVRSTCKEIFLECKWNDNPFNCCKYFTALHTELGPCYAINSLQARDKKAPYLPLISNKKFGPGRLTLKLRGTLSLYIMGEQDVPSITTLPKDILEVSPYIHYRRYISVKEIENEKQVRFTSVEQRKCRFIDENYLDVYEYYSYSACTTQCRKDAQFQKCNCTHHLMPNTHNGKICDVDGLHCLHDNYNDIAVLKAVWANRNGLVCECLPSCTEVEITTIRESEEGILDPYAIVDISLESLPTERFKRNVVRGKLELVVSLGGAAALLLGASLLSVFEFFYFFLLRVFNTARMVKKVHS